MKNDPIQAALARLDDAEPDLAKALVAKSNLIAAKAARIVGNSHLSAFTSQLVAAFNRFLAGGDKGCTALIAIARALVTLDHDDAELFLRGMKHIQREPVWGGSVDSAAELRAACAIGFVNSLHPNKLRELVTLLVDEEWIARAGAVRAIAATGSDSAALLLRYKALLGDPEADVLSDCLIGLLELEGGAALALVRTLAISHDEQVSEAAILALGASRRADAIEMLKELFDGTANLATKKCLLVSLASSRTDAAVDFLMELVDDGVQAAADAMAAIGLERPSSRASTDPTSLKTTTGSARTDRSPRSSS